VAREAGPWFLVRVSDPQGRLVASALAASTTRSSAYGEVYRTFESGGTRTLALREWFMPGSLHGYAFAYPDEEARDLAAAVGARVLATTAMGADADAIRRASVYYVTPDGRRTAVLQDGIADEPPPADDERGLTPGQRATRRLDRAIELIDRALANAPADAAQVAVPRQALEAIRQAVRAGKDAALRIDRPRD
jgi:hypothetical protein